jgi:hypothetical protein
MNIEDFKTRLWKQERYLIEATPYAIFMDKDGAFESVYDVEELKEVLSNYIFDGFVKGYSYEYSFTIFDGIGGREQDKGCDCDQLESYFWFSMKEEYSEKYEEIKDDTLCGHEQSLAEEYFPDFDWNEARDMQHELESRLHNDLERRANEFKEEGKHNGDETL